MSNKSKLTIRGKIVQEFLTKYPDMPSRNIAKLIANSHPIDFKDSEQARGIVRYYRGQSGIKNHKAVSTEEYFKDKGELCPYKLPEEESFDQKPIKLEGSEFGIISDLHIPNHRNKPIEIALNDFNNCDHIIINGDLMDNTPFSRHAPINNRPTPHDVRLWFDKTEYFLEYLRNRFPDCKITWMEGNHDKWYRRWLIQHFAQLSEDPYFDLQERLHLSEYDITYIPEKQYGMIGKLAIHHGHHIIKGLFAPVNAARGAYLKAKRSIIIGHVHVESSHTETDLHGEIVTTYSTGCLCTLTPAYAPISGKACHGYAKVYVEPDGHFSVRNTRIHKDRKL